MISITRSGVRNLARPISACRPTGPPITPESAAPIASVRLGRSRSSRLRRSSASGSGETVVGSRSVTGAEEVQAAALPARVRLAAEERWE